MQYCSDTFFKKPFSNVVCMCMFVPIRVDSLNFYFFSPSKLYSCEGTTMGAAELYGRWLNQINISKGIKT